MGPGAESADQDAGEAGSSSTSTRTGRASNSSTISLTSGSSSEPVVAGDRGRVPGAAAGLGASAGRSNRTSTGRPSQRRRAARSSPGARAARRRRRPNCSPASGSMTRTLGPGSAIGRSSAELRGELRRAATPAQRRPDPPAIAAEVPAGPASARPGRGRLRRPARAAVGPRRSGRSAAQAGSAGAQLFFSSGRDRRGAPTPARRAGRRARRARRGSRAGRPGPGPSRRGSGRAGCPGAGPGPRPGSAARRGSCRAASGRRPPGAGASAGGSRPAGRRRPRRPGPSRRGGIRAGPFSRSAGWTPVGGRLVDHAGAPRPGRGRPGRRAGRAVRSSLAVPSCWWTSSTVSRSPPDERSCSRSDWASRIEPAGPPGDDAAGASGSASTPSRAQISARVSTICSGVIPAKSYRWQRERTVIGILFGSVVAKKNLTCSGGSSSVFSRALKAPGGEHVDFVDVVDLEPGPAGPEAGVLPQLADRPRRRCCWPRRSR